jgi:DNA-binding CsgD family transcriptional regulator
VGGEYPVLVSYIAEMLPSKYRAYLCSYSNVTTVLGVLLATATVSCLAYILPHSAMLAWGWRIPFLITFFSVLCGFYMRLKMDESFVFSYFKKNIPNSNLRLVPGTHLWDSNKKFSPPSNDAREFFNVDNRLDIVTHHGEYYEVFGFGSNRGNTKILDLYLNKIETLKQFTFYFKEMAGPLLKESQKPENRLLIDNIKIYKNIEKGLTTDSNSSKKLSIFNIRQFKFSNFSLSKRELETLALTLRGRSAAEISSILNISPKTVESYLENAKHKFRCANRAELFDKCYDIGVIDFAKNMAWLKKYR